MSRVTSRINDNFGSLNWEQDSLKRCRYHVTHIDTSFHDIGSFRKKKKNYFCRWWPFSDETLNRDDIMAGQSNSSPYQRVISPWRYCLISTDNILSLLQLALLIICDKCGLGLIWRMKISFMKRTSSNLSSWIYVYYVKSRDRTTKYKPLNHWALSLTLLVS